MSARGPSTDVRPRDGSPPGPPAASPPALRPARSRWRDPRLVVGVALVAACALIGARLLGGADDTVGVWVARVPLHAGQPLSTGDLVRRQVRFDDQAAADRYLPADRLPAGGTTLGRSVGAGELVPRAALGSTATGALTEVPLSVDTEAVPSTVRVGTVVDVWVTPDRAAADAQSPAVGPHRSSLVFDDVPVVAVPRTGTSLGPSATRQVIVGVGSDQQPRLPTSLAALSDGSVILTAQR
jgi:hypothetical protein